MPEYSGSGNPVAVSTAVATSSGGNKDTPAASNAAWDSLVAKRTRCRTVFGGTDEIRAGGEGYLPKFEGDTPESYAIRQNLCALFNGFARTVIACVGLILQKRPELGEDTPAEHVEMWENIDRAGTHGAVFTRKFATDGLIDGLAGILVDAPRIEGPPLDRAQEAALGIRPYWLAIEAQDIMAPLYGTIDGVRALVRLTIRERVTVADGAFGFAEINRYRVYRRDEKNAVTCEIWETPKDGGDATKTADAFPMRNIARIPFVPLIANHETDMYKASPPLLNLADLNIEHHKEKTGASSLRQQAYIPSLVAVGRKPDADGNYTPILRGPTVTIEIPADAAAGAGAKGPVYYLSPDSDVLAPGERALQEIKADMGAAGLAFLAPQTRAAETAEAKRIDAQAQSATLKTFASKVQDALEDAFVLTSDFMGLETSGSVTVNDDYEATVMEPAMITALVNAKAQGGLDIETLLTILETGGVLPEGSDIDAIIARIITDGRRELGDDESPYRPEDTETDEAEPQDETLERDAAA